LAEVIKEDLSNLDYIYETYEMDKETFLKLLSDNGKSLNDFVYISEIETYIWTTQYDNEYEAYMQQVSAFLDEIGLTQDELTNLENYFLAMEDYLSSPDVTAELESIMERASAFLTLTEEPVPTEAQIKEIVSIYKDLLSLLKIDIKYTLIKDDKQTTLAIEDFVKLTEEDIKGVDFKISIYNEDGQLLADMLLTSELLGTGDVTDVIEDTVNTIDKHINKNSNSTVKGGQLPTTASAYLPNALWGLAIVFAGIIMYRKVRIVKGGPTKQQ
jgi:processed acidic surface protein